MSWIGVAVEGADADEQREAIAAARERLGDAPPDLCCLFVAGGGHPFAQQTLRTVREVLSPGELVGCGAQGVLGQGRELESGPAVALLAGHLEGAKLHSHYVAPTAMRAGALPEVTAGGCGLLFADPMTTPGEFLLDELGRSAAPVVGGLGGGNRDGAGPIFAGGEQRGGGCVLLEIQGGGWTLDTIVAQGCRPIGQPAFVTSAHEHWLRELDGRPALDTLRELAQRSSAREQELMRHSLFLGIEMRARQSSYGQGDFLVRNLVGVDPDSGALAVAGAPSEGQVVQFHLRDAATSAEDLETHLRSYCEGSGDDTQTSRADPEAALLFSCIGRGQGLYGVPDHDSRTLYSKLGELPLSGFFANGEIGPVGGQTFLHAYTSAFGLLRRQAPG